MCSRVFPILRTHKNYLKKLQFKILSFHGCSIRLEILHSPNENEKNISSECGYVGYQTLCGTLTKILVIPNCLCVLPELRKSKNVLFVKKL